MIRTRVLSSAVVLLSLILFASPARAQEQASIIGSVSDETKSLLPGATITATKLDTGAQSTA